PALLDHLERAGIVERDGRFLYRFDPDANGGRQPVDVLPLLGRIAAPTLLVRGEHSRVLPRELAREMIDRIPPRQLPQTPPSPHLALDQPPTFTAVLERFLEELPG